MMLTRESSVACVVTLKKVFAKGGGWPRAAGIPPETGQLALAVGNCYMLKTLSSQLVSLWQTTNENPTRGASKR